MNKKIACSAWLAVVLLAAIAPLPGLAADDPVPQPPVAAKIAKELVRHGHVRNDEYYWLNQRENPDVISYLQAENAYTDAVMKPAAGLRAALYKEMVGRMQQRDMSVPYFENGYWYYTRFEAGKEYPVLLPQEKIPAGRRAGAAGRQSHGGRGEIFQYRLVRRQPRQRHPGLQRGHGLAPPVPPALPQPENREGVRARRSR